MYELNEIDINKVSGGSSELVIAAGSLATTLSRGNPILASATAGYTMGTAIHNKYGSQINDWVWDSTQQASQLSQSNPHTGRAF
ncbi:hypothetical protein [Marinobacter sp. HL-58]|uniref:hypothetical protein n=1 Tax=Marinobacter sp. HL-58 TaxID=1479237 RepID=UPI0012DC6BA1|nr:hypothetical protein [Marinobacter sp. HL-58]